MRLRILIALGISLLLSLVMVLTLRFVAQQLQPPPPYVGTMIYPPEKLPDFALTDTNNATVGLDLYRGKLTLMAFGYTHCPDVCPMTLGDFRRVKTALGDSASEAQFVFITVDGERDTAEYLQSTWYGLTPASSASRGNPIWFKPSVRRLVCMLRSDKTKRLPPIIWWITLPACF